MGVPCGCLFSKEKRKREEGKRRTFRVSILAPEAYRYRQRSSLRRIIRKARSTRFERERERGRKREKERSDPDRVDARVRASRSRWSGSLAEREGERERVWIPFTLLFSQLSFLSLLGVVAAVKKAKKGRKTGKFGPKRARSGSA